MPSWWLVAAAMAASFTTALTMAGLLDILGYDVHYRQWVAGAATGVLIGLVIFWVRR